MLIWICHPRPRSESALRSTLQSIPLLLVDDEKLDDTLQLNEDILYEKQVQVHRNVRELKGAKEKWSLVEKSASFAFPFDHERIQGEIQDGKGALAVALRDLHACREQCSCLVSYMWHGVLVARDVQERTRREVVRQGYVYAFNTVVSYTTLSERFLIQRATSTGVLQRCILNFVPLLLLLSIFSTSNFYERAYGCLVQL